MQHLILKIILLLAMLPAFATGTSVKTCDNLTDYPEILKQIRHSTDLKLVKNTLIQAFKTLINESLVAGNDKLTQYRSSILQIKTDVNKWHQDTLDQLQTCEKYWNYTIDKNLGRYYGLIIGINNYQNWPRLTTAINDAKMIDEVLNSKYGFNNQLLINASYKEIVTTFKRLKAKLTVNDNLLIYYAGRSHRDADGQSYWLPADAERTEPKNWLKTNIITQELLIENDSMQNVLIVSDSFYSSPLTQYYKKKEWLLKDQKVVQKLLDKLPKYMLTDSKVELLKLAINKSRILLESNNDKPVLGNDRHSILAQNLLAALNNQEGKTIFTISNLVSDMLQTLQYKLLDSNSKGDFVFKQPHKFVDANDILKQKQSLSLIKLAHKEISKGHTTNGMLFTLEALPKYTFAPDRPYTFAAEKKLYEAILKQREYKIIYGDEQPIHRVDFSPDGLRIATASTNGQVRLWNANGILLNVLQGQQVFSNLPSIAFSPDSSQLITSIANDNAARLWNVETGQLIKILYGHQKGINHVAFSPFTNQVITVAEDARIWQNGELVNLLIGHEKTINYAAFSPDIVVTVSDDNTARLWSSHTGKLIHILTGHTDKINHASFSPDGKTIVTAANDNTARVWNVETGESIAVFRGHNDNVLNAAFSPDGHFIITASKDKTANLWEAGKLRKILSGHKQALTFATFSPSGKFIILTSEDHTASLWETETGKRISILAGHTAKVNHAAFSPDSKFVATVADDGVMRLWQVANRNNFKILAGHKSRVLNADFSADGTQVVTASDDNTARVWDTASGKLLKILIGHENGVNQALFSGSQIITASDDKTTRIWTADKSFKIIAKHIDEVNYIALSPDHSKLVMASDEETTYLWQNFNWNPLSLWNYYTNKSLIILSGHKNKVLQASFSPNSKIIATVSADKTARLWDADTGELLRVLKGHKNTVNQVEFSPDGKLIITVSDDKTARLWYKNGKLFKVLKGHRDKVNHAAFSPDGKFVVTASDDNTARLWITKTGKLFKVLRGHKDEINYVAFSPDGQFIVTASDDNTVRIWKNGKLFNILFGHEDEVNYANFSPDGKFIITASDDKTARLWRVFSVQELIDYANKIVPTCLTIEQRQKFSLPLTESQILLTQAEELAKHDLEAAITAFTQVKKLAPCYKFEPEDKSRQIFANNLINQALAAENIATSITKFKQAQAIDSRFNSHQIIANLLVHQGEKLAKQGVIDESIAKFAEALTFEPNLDFNPENKMNAVVLIEQGKYLAREGDIDNAITKFKAALEFDTQLNFEPKDKAVAQIQMQQGEILAQNGDFKAAIENFATARMLDFQLQFIPKDKANAQLLLQEGEKLARNGKLEQAIEKFKDALVLDSQLNFNPENKAIAQKRMYEGTKLAQEHNIEAAVAKFKQAVSLDAQLEFTNEIQMIAQELINTGRQLARDGKIKQAIEQFKAAIAFDSRLNFNPQRKALAHLRAKEGELLADSGKIEAAKEKFKVAMELDDKLIAPKIKKFAQLLVQQGKELAEQDIEAAVIKFKEARLLDPQLTFYPRQLATDTMAQVRLQEGEQLAAIGDSEAAIEKFREARTLNQRLDFNPEIKVGKLVAKLRVKEGTALVQHGAIEVAVRKFQQALQLDPQLQAPEIKAVAELLIKQGEQLARGGDIEAATLKFRQARQLDLNLEFNFEEMTALWIHKEEQEREEWWGTAEQVGKVAAAIGFIAMIIIIL